MPDKNHPAPAARPGAAPPEKVQRPADDRPDLPGAEDESAEEASRPPGESSRADRHRDAASTRTRKR